MDLDGQDPAEVERYLRWVAGLPVPDQEHERALAVQARSGGGPASDQARKALIESHLRLVVSIAKRYRDRGLTFVELIHAGTTGLVRAVEGFDPARGFRLSSWATWWIRQAITRAMAERGRAAGESGA